MTFEAFPKIARLNRECVITEKLDGTNAQLMIVPYEEATPEQHSATDRIKTTQGLLYAGSRTRWITPGKSTDNFGFAAWAWDNAEELVKLGPGRHYGEWWGKGIQRGYGLAERRFSLFNTHRWSDWASRPLCVDCVPVLYQGAFTTDAVSHAVSRLATFGSAAAPFNDPEGVIVFHTAQNSMFKVTIKDDEVPKALAKEAALPPAAGERWTGA